MIHELKILPQYFKAVQEGTKTFEIRKNDRGFKAGDTILLKEYINKFEGNSNLPYAGYYTGQEITKEISYILEGGQYGLEEGYCILGLKPTFKSETLNKLLDVGLDEKAIQECYERYRWHIDYYKDAIILKNIDLTGIMPIEQARKTDEEIREFCESFNIYKSEKTEENKNHVIEEYFDMLQASLGLLEKEGIKAEEVQAYYPKHLEKLEKRGNKPRIKKCSKCIKKDNCKLYINKNWTGEKEAESCRTYMEQEE